MEILPVLDHEVLKEKANEYAMKGAIESIKDYYTGYNSPFKKAIEGELQKTAIGHGIALPDIIALINQSLSKEIDTIANTAVSKTFVPMVKEFLTRADAELNLSDILKEFIDCSRWDDDIDRDDYSVEIKKDDGSFTYILITNGKKTYEVHFYNRTEKGDTAKSYDIYRLPEVTGDGSDRYSYSQKQTMKISLDGGATLEMPFHPKVLEDKFTSYIATLVIAKSKITFDVTDFNDDMFPQDECHCN